LEGFRIECLVVRLCCFWISAWPQSSCMRPHCGDLRLSSPDWNEYELLSGIRVAARHGWPLRAAVGRAVLR
jgi:hypothetical protein